MKLKPILLSIILFVVASFVVTSCDPCSGVLCENGTCSNGSCLCLDGYEKDHNYCIALNLALAGMYTDVSQMESDSSSQSSYLIDYTIEADSANPRKCILRRFNNLNDNDIVFNISSDDPMVIDTETVVTGIGNTYVVSGSRTPTQLELTISDDPMMYTLTFDL